MYNTYGLFVVSALAESTTSITVVMAMAMPMVVAVVVAMVVAVVVAVAMVVVVVVVVVAFDAFLQRLAAAVIQLILPLEPRFLNEDYPDQTCLPSVKERINILIRDIDRIPIYTSSTENL